MFTRSKQKTQAKSLLAENYFSDRLIKKSHGNAEGRSMPWLKSVPGGL
jgi:hypothetical protein